MSFVVKFIILQALIIIPFSSGSLIKNRLHNTGLISERLVKFNLIFIDSQIVFWSVWGLDLKTDLIFLPLFGIFLVLLGLALGYGFMPVLRLQGKERATFLISSSLANHGFTMGAFLCYILLGEKGIGYALLFMAYFMPYVFLFIFPFASISSQEVTPLERIRSMILTLRNMPLYAMAAALILNLLEIGRPDIGYPLDLLIMVSVSVYYFSLGINFNPGYMRSIKVENITAVFLFIMLPVLFLLRGFILNL